MRVRRIAMAMACVALGGCVSTRSIALGPPAAPRARHCELRFERRDPVEAANTYRIVGTVCLSDPTHVADAEDVYVRSSDRESLREEACTLGGELVSPVGLCANGRESGIEFGVYRARQP